MTLVRIFLSENCRFFSFFSLMFSSFLFRIHLLSLPFKSHQCVIWDCTRLCHLLSIFSENEESPMTCNEILIQIGLIRGIFLSMRNNWNGQKGETKNEKYDFMTFCTSNHNNSYDYDPYNSICTHIYAEVGKSFWTLFFVVAFWGHHL